MGHRQQTVRDLLRNSDGMTVAQIAEAVGTDNTHVHRMLHKFPDAYIDRWLKTGRRLAAVWCVVVPPSHCPRPDKKKKEN